MRHVLLAITALGVLASCDPEDPTPERPTIPNPEDMPEEMTTEPDMPVDLPPTCEPATCESLGANICGPQSDGCDGTLNCGPCGCDANDLEGSCDAQPCQVATGCAADGGCEYEPVMCSGLTCACPDGEDCGEDPVRCTDACPALACDPSPMMVDGKVQYQNTCVNVQPATCVPENTVCDIGGVCDGDTCNADVCGVCGLGQWVCPPGEATVCDPIEIGSLDASAIQCDDNALNSTFLFVDTTAAVMGATGSRMRPFATLDVAVEASRTRSVRAIVIAGSPMLQGLSTWDVPLSLYGGYTNVAGIWTRDVTQRPIISGDAFESDGTHVGLRVTGEASDIVLSGLRIEARPAQMMSGAGSIALALKDVSDVTLHDLELQGGEPAAGDAGQEGARGEPGRPGATSSNNAGAAAGANPSCGGANGGRGGNGGFGTNPSLPGQASPGGVPGGRSVGINTNGEDGSTGTTPAPPDAGTPDTFGGSVQGFAWIPENQAQNGAAGALGPGGGGGGGGGGGSGFGIGGGGGGGGAGGCGGGPGTRGRPGGAAIGVLLTGATDITVLGGTWSVPAGGAGGDGGAGGLGGQGLPGGGRRQGINNGRRSGMGGDGVDGASGSDGGPGAGGPSWGILCADASTFDVQEMPSVMLGGAGAGGTNSAGSAPMGASAEIQACEMR